MLLSRDLMHEQSALCWLPGKTMHVETNFTLHSIWTNLMRSLGRHSLTSLGVALALLVGSVAAQVGTGASTSVVCNCGTEGDLTGANVQHSKTAKVFVNTESGRTDVGSHETGESGNAFTNQTVSPGKCKYVRYTFNCEQTPIQWICTVNSYTLDERDVTANDCASAPPE